MFRKLKSFLIVFREDTRGTVTVESALMIPLLFWAWATVYVFFDAYRQTSMVQKAAYTIGDILSRETGEINSTYINNVFTLYGILTKSKTSNSVRISLIRYDAKNDKFSIDWSQARGAPLPLKSSDVTNWQDKLPVMPDDERVIYVETWSKYAAPFTVGLENETLHGTVFTRPRFADRICFQGSCG